MGITILIIFVLAIAGAIVWFFIKNKKEEPSVQPEKPSNPPADEVPKGDEKEPEKPKEEEFKPKFKVGDLITNGTLVGKIDEINKFGYHAYFGDYYADVPDAENWHKWTIQDAKDGDVLAFDDDTIVIFKDLYNATTFHSYCHIEDGVFDISEEDMPDWWEGEGFHPATKEQRDLLFQKMKEAGYDWDSHTNKMIYNNDYRRLR